MDDDSVQTNGDLGVLDLLSVLRFGVGKVDVIGLPAKWREASIHIGILDRIDAPAFVVCALQAKGVEDLHLKGGVVEPLARI